MSAQKLYTPQLLGLAVELAQHPLVETLPLQGEGRSQACGSTLALALALDADERIERLGMRVRACAVGQAAAAIFARHAAGRDEADLRAMVSALRAWLDGADEMPEWPDLDLLAPARTYPGRHGAIMLPWQAAIDALSTASATS